MAQGSRGAAQEYTEAVRLYNKTAEQGHAKAQAYPRLQVLQGPRLPQALTAEAVRWYRKAAEQGDTKAQFNLGFMYDSGKGKHDTLRRFTGTAKPLSRGT